MSRSARPKQPPVQSLRLLRFPLLKRAPPQKPAMSLRPAAKTAKMLLRVVRVAHALVAVHPKNVIQPTEDEPRYVHTCHTDAEQLHH